MNRKHNESDNINIPIMSECPYKQQNILGIQMTIFKSKEDRKNKSNIRLMFMSCNQN